MIQHDYPYWNDGLTNLPQWDSDACDRLQPFNTLRDAIPTTPDDDGHDWRWVTELMTDDSPDYGQALRLLDISNSHALIEGMPNLDAYQIAGSARVPELIVDITDVETVAWLQDVARRLEHYAIIDEDDYARRQWDAGIETLTNCYSVALDYAGDVLARLVDDGYDVECGDVPADEVDRVVWDVYGRDVMVTTVGDMVDAWCPDEVPVFRSSAMWGRFRDFVPTLPLCDDYETIANALTGDIPSSDWDDLPVEYRTAIEAARLAGEIAPLPGQLSMTGVMA